MVHAKYQKQIVWSSRQAKHRPYMVKCHN